MNRHTIFMMIAWLVFWLIVAWSRGVYAQTVVTLGRGTVDPSTQFAPVCIYTYGSSPSCLTFMAIKDGTLAVTGMFPSLGIGPQLPAIPFDVNYFANSAHVPAPSFNASARIVGPDGLGSALDYDTFGGTGAFECRRADGTAASPLPINNTDTLPICSFQAYGWNGTSYTPQVAGSIDIATGEPIPWSGTANGTILRFRTTAQGTAGPQITNMVIFGDGGVLIGNSGQGTTPVNISTDPGSYVLEVLNGISIGPKPPASGVWLDINANANAASVPAPPSMRVGTRLVGADSFAVSYMLDSFGGATTYIGRRADGSAASMTAVQAGDVLEGLQAIGFTDADIYSPVAGAIQIEATSAFTAFSNATRINFNTTPVGSTANTSNMILDGFGHLQIGSVQPTIDIVGCSGGSFTSGTTSTDAVGKVTTTGVTSCKIDFAGTYNISVPACSANDVTTAAPLTVLASGSSFIVGGLTSGDTFTYFCPGI